MESLKTLIVINGRFSKGPKHLPNSLRVLEWHRYPSWDIPSDFCPKKLIICKFPESCLTSFEFLGSLKRFAKMRELNLDMCQSLTKIPDVSGFPNLEEFSFRQCENLVTIHDSIGFLNKLKILRAQGCSKLKSFPPIKLTSLQELGLSYCHSLENFPEILGKMEGVTSIFWRGNSIETLPFSILNLTRLHTLMIEGPKTPKLSQITSSGCCLLAKQNDKPSSMVSLSNVEVVQLYECNVSDEFLPICLTWFANVKDLCLSRNNFTILPECLKECHFLRNLKLDDCKRLQEIRGIPPNLKHLSALRCESLTSSCRSMLLNQELHEVGGTKFRLPGTTEIPDWFEHRSRGPSISFWFRNKIPSIALFVVCKLMHKECLGSEFIHRMPNLNIKGCTFDNPLVYFSIELDHTYLVDLELEEYICLDEALLENEWIHVELTFERHVKDKAFLRNEWIHAEVTFEDDGVVLGGGTPPRRGSTIECGIHVFKQESSMEDIQFTNPYEKRELDDVDDVDHYSQ